MDKKLNFKSFGKLNLLLKVMGKKDNLHLLKMINTEITLFDEINAEITYPGSGSIKLNMIPGYDLDSKDNLVYKAVKLYLERTNLFFDIKITIDKIIPPGSGLGGGSSNAAYTLLNLNKIFNKLSKKELLDIGFSLGSDLPFFIYGGLCYVSRFGEVVKPTKIQLLCDKYFLIIIPSFSLSTKEVYGKYDSLIINQKENNNIKHETESLNFQNDLYIPAKTLKPEIENIINDLISTEPIDCLMTGSGSGCFGIFDSEEKVNNAFNELQSKYSKIFIALPKLDRNI